MALLLVTGAACDGKQSTGGTGGDDAAADAAAGGDGGAADASSLPGRVILNRVRINSHSKQENFQRARAPFDLGAGPFAKVTLTVELATTCFPFALWKDDMPPSGQNWPPKCDAFDRLFEVILDGPTAEGQKPGIELVRAITPFGGPLRFEADITDVINGLPGAHTLEAYIDTWSDGAGKVTGSDAGWTVSASITATKGPAPREVLGVVPLFHGSQRQAKVEPIGFAAPAGTGKIRVEYRATGHTLEAGPRDAACLGPAEEFCRRKHVIELDGAAVDEFDAWKTDCATLCTPLRLPGPNGQDINICTENPCGAMASVRAPRANWCPGSVSPPRVIEQALAPGEHKLGWGVDVLQMGGSWRISAAAIFYRN
ncbi:MAG TPA: peptide-N-glycosidase F-related protein [Polyangia bacterium]